MQKMTKVKNNSLYIIILTAVIAVFLAFGAGQSAITRAEQNNTTADNGNITSQIKNNEASVKTGQITAQEHQNIAANFVQNMLNVGNRVPSETGDRVRAITLQQYDSENTTTRAIHKIELRNKIKTFLIGSDYKSLGALKSEMLATQDRINRLLDLLPDIQNASDTAEIISKLQDFQQEQIKINNFIAVQKSKLSLLGWLFKFFN